MLNNYKIIAAKKEFPRTEILLDGLRSTFAKMQSLPPILIEFPSDLEYEIALKLFESGKTGLCALVRLLYADVFWFKGGQKATRSDVANCLLDKSGGRENKIADQIDREDLPCNTPFQIELLEGDIFLDKLTDEERSVYASYNSSFIKGIQTLYYFYCLNESEEETQTDKKIFWLNLAILLFPDMPFAYLRILKQAGISADLKKQYIKLFLNYNGNNPLSLYYLSEYYIEIKDYENARQYLSMAINFAPKPAVLYIKRGEIYLMEEDGDLALTDFQHAIELEPDADYTISAYGKAASILADKQEFYKALELLDIAIKKAKPKSQEHTSSLLLKALILYAMNRVEEAIEIGKFIWGNTLLDDQILSILIQYLSGPREVD